MQTDPAFRAAVLPPKTATPPLSAVAASPDTPAAAPAPLAGKKTNQQEGITKKATIAEVCILSRPGQLNLGGTVLSYVLHGALPHYAYIKDYASTWSSPLVVLGMPCQ